MTEPNTPTPSLSVGGAPPDPLAAYVEHMRGVTMYEGREPTLLDRLAKEVADTRTRLEECEARWESLVDYSEAAKDDLRTRLAAAEEEADRLRVKMGARPGSVPDAELDARWQRLVGAWDEERTRRQSAEAERGVALEREESLRQIVARLASALIAGGVPREDVLRITGADPEAAS